MKTSKTIKQTQWGIWMALLLTIGGGLTACRDNAIDDLSTDDSQVFITNYDRNVNFGQYRTFSLPDSVLVESNNTYRGSLSTVEARFINQLAAALTSRGFQRVAQGQTADMGVAAIRVNNRYTGVTSVPYSPYYLDYWYGAGFYGGLGPGFGGFYPYYPNYYQFYQVSEQYWQVQVVDLRNRPANGGNTGSDQNQLRVIYQADIRGNGIFSEESVDRAVNAIFEQSPYLQAAP
ncbi:DUF4136 domain-containing protein [Fibrisoma montanum]|uniref:DUF4136 domain-containing protein n=1 Tax=Fibrisoma montanum TaxID=2305895 RepID=A0A418LWZ9_9BACT|nr:DUF4136 domain-containing protein [Fibrisoma montanum]RIV17878.1 DUF4136 domain-containing protein [Fibrisoma montanum]